MVKAWFWNRFRSLYLKIFLSFLGTCVLFFVGLGVFWNYYFTDLFYKDKKGLLQDRYVEVTKLLTPFQEGTVSTRELRFGIRIIARGINGQVWLVDSKGTILNGSSENEALTIPKSIDPTFIEGMKGHSGFQMAMQKMGETSRESVLIYYAPWQLNGQPIVILLQVPAVEISEAISAVRVNILVPLLFSLLAVGVILYIISRRLAAPLQQMNRAALELAQGDFSTRVSISSNDEVGQLGKSFNFMVDQLEQWEDTRQEFLTNVTHELRSPLTTLRGFIVAMNDGVIPEAKYSHYLQICDYEVQRLQRLVNDLLDLARIQNGVDVFRLQPICVADKVIEVLELLKSPIEKKQLELEVLLPTDQGKSALALLDPDRFAQILQNLLYNAIQFTPSGQKVIVALEVLAEEVILYVSDTGIGISEEELARVWDRFYKADESRSARTDGTGLGLTIVRHLVSAMKGLIYVRSEKEVGTEFKIIFPRI